MATIDQLLNMVPDRPQEVLSHLANQPQLASAQDFSGYSLLHAAVSYGHADLVRSLINQYGVSVSIKDEDGDTPICAAESVDMARLLVEEFHADLNSRNAEGLNPEEKIEAEEDFPMVAAYLREAAAQGSGAAGASVAAQTAGANTSGAAQARTVNGDAPTTNGVTRVPPGIGDIRIGTAPEPEDDGFVPDPEFRRRIEELAAREDFQSEQGQADLRHLVEDVVSGMREEQRGQDRSTRQRTD